MAALFRAQDVACATNLQVPQRQLETCAQMRVAADRLQTVPRVGGQCAHRRHEHIRERLSVVAAHTSTQLIKFRQAETIRAIYNNGIRVWNIDAAFDDRRADQHVVIAFHEFCHDVFQLAGRHLPMRDDRSRCRDEFLDHFLHLIDGLHTIVQEEDLSAALHLAHNGLTDQFHVELRDNRRHRQAIRRRRHDRAQIADA